MTFRLRVPQFSCRQFRKAATIQYRCLKLSASYIWTHLQRAFNRAMLVALRKKVSMYNLSNSSDTSDTVALAALCDSQLLISGKQLKVRLSLESHRLRLKTTHALTLILTRHWYSRHSESEVGGTIATCGAPSGDHRVMGRGRQMVQLPVTSTAVMCCSVSPRSQLSAGSDSFPHI